MRLGLRRFGVLAGALVTAFSARAEPGAGLRAEPAETPASAQGRQAEAPATTSVDAPGGQTVRFATWNAGLSRSGPGLLLRDLRAQDAQTRAVVDVLKAARADVLLLTGFDWDFRSESLAVLQAQLAAAGVSYPYHYAPQSNTGRATGLDLDGDGRLGGARDAQGYGRFTGAGGMALLSQLPLDMAAAQDFSAFLWADLPQSLLEGAEVSEAARQVQRLSTTGHWRVPVQTGSGAWVSVLAFAATPPVFDGPEDRNGRRNHDEAAFWLRYHEGRLPWPAPDGPVVLMGEAALDPVDGEGRPQALLALLAGPWLQDPRPMHADGPQAHGAQTGGSLPDGATGARPVRGGAGHGRPDVQQPSQPAQLSQTQQTTPLPHRGDPRLDTAEYAPPVGALRVDYVLPSADLKVAGAGVIWPAHRQAQGASAPHPAPEARSWPPQAEGPLPEEAQAEEPQPKEPQPKEPRPKAPQAVAPQAGPVQAAEPQTAQPQTPPKRAAHAAQASPDAALAKSVLQASRHRLVWVDIVLP